MPKTNGVTRLDKRQIEQRIEEDRERHKRLRESIWAVGDDEFERMWEEVGEMDEDDYALCREERAEKDLVLGVV
jgi:CTD kinase subunit gamma